MAQSHRSAWLVFKHKGSELCSVKGFRRAVAKVDHAI